MKEMMFPPVPVLCIPQLESMSTLPLRYEKHNESRVCLEGGISQGEHLDHVLGDFVREAEGIPFFKKKKTYKQTLASFKFILFFLSFGPITQHVES